MALCLLTLRNDGNRIRQWNRRRSCGASSRIQRLATSSPCKLSCFRGKKRRLRRAREQAATALALLGDFYAYLVGLESKLEAHAFAELASKMDMGAVGGVVVENMLSAGEKLLERILVGGFSEALMVLASRQYVKAFKRTRAGRCYSYLSATIGSTFVARQAGRRHAISTVPASTSVTSPNVTGSVGLTP